MRFLPDSTGKADTTAIPSPLLRPPPPLKPFVKLTPHLDSLLTLLFGAAEQPGIGLDLPQETSRLDYDPLLFRLSSAQWGELESVYPAALSPSALSVVDPLCGDESFANPVPIPGSEELTRLPYSGGYRLLTPSLAGSASPFGRPFVIYQSLSLPDDDTSKSKIYVTRGTGGFANTTFTFENHFGPAGIVNADGTFIKKNGAGDYGHSNLTRLRIVSRPALARDLSTDVGYFLNRLSGDKLIFAPTGLYTGSLGDNYSGLFAHLAYYASETVNYRAALSYRNDDQGIDFSNLHSRQRFQVFDGHLSQQVLARRHNLEIGADLRFLRYRENFTTHKPIYFSGSLSDLLTLSEKLSLSGAFSLRGSSDLKPRPEILLSASCRFDSLRSLSLIASRSLLLPQPEMLYLRPVLGGFADTTTTYRISGNSQLESGYSNNLESLLQYSLGQRVKVEARAGFSNFHGLPLWLVDYTQYSDGDYQVVAQDRNLFYSSASLRMSLPRGIYGQASYGFRRVFVAAQDYSEGTEHSASGYAGIRFPVHKLKIMINAAVGGRFRTLTRFLPGGEDDARFLTEAYLSFDLKSFHFFWNYADLLDLAYSVGGYLQPGRQIWWGFNWAFID
jgi:hypothetical protein